MGDLVHSSFFEPIYTFYAHAEQVFRILRLLRLLQLERFLEAFTLLDDVYYVRSSFCACLMSLYTSALHTPGAAP